MTKVTRPNDEDLKTKVTMHFLAAADILRGGEADLELRWELGFVFGQQSLVSSKIGELGQAGICQSWCVQLKMSLVSQVHSIFCNTPTSQYQLSS